MGYARSRRWRDSESVQPPFTISRALSAVPSSSCMATRITSCRSNLPARPLSPTRRGQSGNSRRPVTTLTAMSRGRGRPPSPTGWEWSSDAVATTTRVVVRSCYRPIRGYEWMRLVERMEVPAMAERKSAKTDRKQSAKRTTGKASSGFTAEERAAMRERAQELKAEARATQRQGGRGKRRAREDRRDAEPGSRPGRAAPRDHQSQRAGPVAENLVRDARVCPGRQGRLLLPARAEVQGATRRSASTTGRTSTKAPCGRPPSR